VKADNLAKKVAAQHAAAESKVAAAAEVSASCFVAASHVEASALVLCCPAYPLLVSYSPASLPSIGAPPQTGEQVADARLCDRAAPPLDGCSIASVFAWTINAWVAIASCVCSLIALEARKNLPSLLLASSVDDDAWLDAVARAYVLSVLSSLLIVDVAKVLCLTLTGRPALDACAGHHGARGRAARIFGKSLRKPLRRCHKVLDVVV